MNYLVFESDHWLVTHRRDARYPGYLMVSSRDQHSELHNLDSGSLKELGLVLQRTEELLSCFRPSSKVIFYKLGFSNGFGCHFHAAPVTCELLSEITSHPDYSDDPDGNDAILFLSRVYCERQLTDKETERMTLIIDELRELANKSFDDGRGDSPRL